MSVWTVHWRFAQCLSVSSPLICSFLKPGPKILVNLTVLCLLQKMSAVASCNFPRTSLPRMTNSPFLSTMQEFGPGIQFRHPLALTACESWLVMVAQCVTTWTFTRLSTQWVQWAPNSFTNEIPRSFPTNRTAESMKWIPRNAIIHQQRGFWTKGKQSHMGESPPVRSSRTYWAVLAFSFNLMRKYNVAAVARGRGPFRTGMGKR